MGTIVSHNDYRYVVLHEAQLTRSARGLLPNVTSLGETGRLEILVSAYQSQGDLFLVHGRTCWIILIHPVWVRRRSRQ